MCLTKSPFPETRKNPRLKSQPVKTLRLVLLKFLLLAPLFLFVFAPGLKATVLYWDNNGTGAPTSGTWNTTSAQWSTSSALTASTVVWNTADAACFSAGSSTNALTITVNSTITSGGFFNGSLNPPGVPLTFSGTGQLNLPSGSQASASSGGSDGYGTTVNVVISGPGQLWPEGGNGLVLNGSNTYSGGTMLDGGGGVSFGNNAAFGTGPIYWNIGGFIQPATTAAFNIANTMYHTNNLIETFAGNTGGVTFSGQWVLGSLTYVELENIADIITVAGPITGSANLTFTNKNGAGWTLTGTNTFTGGLTNGVGNLTLGGSGKLGNGSYSGNFLNNGNFIHNSSSDQTLGGIISGSGTLTTIGPGKLSLSGPNTFTGGTTNSGGTLSVNTIADSGTSALSTSGTLYLNGGTLQYTGASAATTSRAVKGIATTTSTLDLVSGNLTLNNGITAANNGNFTVTKNGAATLTLAGSIDDAYLGMNVNAGTVLLAKSSSASVHGLGSASTIAGPGVLKLGGTGGDQIYSGVTITMNTNGTLDMGGTSEGFSMLTGLQGVVTNSGSTASILQLGENNTGGYYYGTIVDGTSGTVGLTKTGTGNLILGGSNTASGPFAVIGGMLTLTNTGSLGNNCTVYIYSGATFNVATLSSGSWALGSGGALDINANVSNPAIIQGPSSGTVSLGSSPLNFNIVSQQPALNVSQGTLVLNGNAFTVTNSGSAMGPGTFTLITATNINATGTFPVSVVGNGLVAGNAASISVSSTVVTLVVKTTASFSGLSAMTNTYGTTSVSLSGKISAGTSYPAMGESVTATINGHAVSGNVTDSTGDFSINYNDASLATNVAGTYTIAYSYAGDSTLTSATDSSTSLTIKPAALTVAAANQTKTYGQTVASGAGSTNFVAAGLKNGETIGSVTIFISFNGGASNATVAGSPYNITPSSATGGTWNPANYSLTYSVGTLSVLPATLTVTADSFTRAFGETNPVFTAEYTNFVNGETLGTSDVHGSPSLTTAATTNSDAGNSYRITNSLGTLTSTNYIFNLVNGVLSVTNALSTNTLTASTNAALAGTPIVFMAALSTLAPSSAVPTNVVRFVVDGTNDAASVYPSNGVARYTNSTLSPGSHIIAADYAGDRGVTASTNIVGSTNSISVTISSEASSPPVNITSVTRLANGAVQLNFSGTPNYTYLIEVTTNLTSPITWTILSTNTAGTNGLFQYTDTSATNYPGRYYRTAVPPGY